jgi:hypothetical protein
MADVFCFTTVCLEAYSESCRGKTVAFRNDDEEAEALVFSGWAEILQVATAVDDHGMLLIQEA